MTTSFSALPIVDVGALREPNLQAATVDKLSKELYDVFSTTGFAYLVNTPLSFGHEEIFGLAREFFTLPVNEKMRLAKKSFHPGHRNTYRGYFPVQPHLASDNLKEGFEIGNPRASHSPPIAGQKINLSEPNVWPNKSNFAGQEKLEQTYEELQAFASQLLSLLAVSLGKDADFFNTWLINSLSTLRLLHYPPGQKDSNQDATEVKLTTNEPQGCTPHTDSGILTLLHQDKTGGLEVLNASGDWVPAPYVPNSIVVNIGDLMATVSGGRFTATMHRVRTPASKPLRSGDEMGRFSVPFFFEPGEECVVVPVDGDAESIVYGAHVRKKMATFVEFQEDSGYDTGTTEEL
ncbi:putative gibberellin 20-oxidase [Periconia macrospinosa]|uniref:Putative gibberellin 20-oxidase n=1 Tax=Periconia macrospinosa TaxID=97972 RepID=A0A2V1E2D4_9PLEO|nr:putative gibberellin 20-oxidase [Periconia macrospinosa]